MNISDLQDELRPWLALPTWSTSHPLDQERFHRALQSAMRRNGAPIPYQDLYEAIIDLARRLYPDLADDHINVAADQYARQGETIGTYLSDTGQI